MHRVKLHAADGGLGLVVTDRKVPGLRLEVTSGRRMLLRQPGRLVLLGKVHQWHYGVHVYRTADYLSPLPPLRADQARQIGPSDTTWFGRWAHRFASWLDDTDAGPLHNGFWILRPRRLPPYCLRGDLVTNYPAAYLDWFGDGWNGVLPLRQLPDADDARVKAYRRQAREQVLPPILLWVVTGFDGYLLIDGHCRLAAALAEGIEPPVLGLAISSDPGGDSEWLNQVTTGHVELMDRLNEQAARGLADPSRAADALARRFADMCADLPEEGRTRAWPVRDRRVTSPGRCVTARHVDVECSTNGSSPP